VKSISKCRRTVLRKNKTIILFLLAAVCAAGYAQSARTSLGISLDTRWEEEIGYGESVSFQGEVKNRSRNRIDDIRISSTVPEGWTIGIVPEYVQKLSPGERRAFSVQITPKRSLYKETERIVVTAQAGLMEVEYRFEIVVSAGKIWLSVAIGLAVLVITAFVIVFLRLERIDRR
jgi:uncharacterized membrane protein